MRWLHDNLAPLYWNSHYTGIIDDVTEPLNRYCVLLEDWSVLSVRVFVCLCVCVCMLFTPVTIILLGLSILKARVAVKLMIW